MCMLGGVRGGVDEVVCVKGEGEEGSESGRGGSKEEGEKVE